MALTGVSVPVDFWPPAVGLIAHALPITHGLSAVRLAFSGGSAVEIGWLAVDELAVGGVWFALCVLAASLLANVGRRDGSIDATA